MIKTENILISPIRAVLGDLADTTADFILCSADPDICRRQGNNVLAFHFMDTEEEDHPLRFMDEHACRIAAFLSRNDANKDLFVCCDSGESRSSAIAAAISLAIGKNDFSIWSSAEYHPNRLVFSIMCKRLGVVLSAEEINARKVMNDNAFRATVKEGNEAI